MQDFLKEPENLLWEWGRCMRIGSYSSSRIAKIDSFIKSLPEEIKEPVLCKFVGKLSTMKGSRICKISNSTYENRVREGKVAVWTLLNVSREP